MTVIAMPREMGTLGKDVALGVAEELGIEIAHHELVERDIAGKMKIAESTVHEFLEGKPSLWDRWKIDQKQLARFTAEEMLELAGKGNVLIRGWGAVSLLRRVPHVLSLRVCAPMDFRAKILKDRLSFDTDGMARRAIKKNEEAHERSAKLRGVTNWTNAENFDLVLNTQRTSISDCVDQVVALSKTAAFAVTTESTMILQDMLIESRIRANFAKTEGGDLFSSGLEIFVDRGEVAVTGIVKNRAVAEKAYQIAGGAGGVKRVSRNVTIVAPSYGGVIR